MFICITVTSLCLLSSRHPSVHLSINQLPEAPPLELKPFPVRPNPVDLYPRVIFKDQVMLDRGLALRCSFRRARERSHISCKWMADDRQCVTALTSQTLLDGRAASDQKIIDYQAENRSRMCPSSTEFAFRSFKFTSR